MFYEKCDRCQKGDENRFKGRRRAARVLLARTHFHAILCPECCTEWDDERIHNLPRRSELEEVSADYLVAQEEANRDALLLAQRSLTQFAIEYTQAAREFVAEKITREEPDE